MDLNKERLWYRLFIPTDITEHTDTIYKDGLIFSSGEDDFDKSYVAYFNKRQRYFTFSAKFFEDILQNNNMEGETYIDSSEILLKSSIANLNSK